MANLGALESLDFVSAWLDAGASILDVGCGDGHLAKLLLDRGFRVTAIDSKDESIEKAQSAGVNASKANFLEFESEHRFDAILFSRALHHILPVEQAVARAHALVADEGILLLEDFGAELFDGKTALWFYGLKSVIEADLKDPKGRGPKTEEGLIPADPVGSWRRHLFEKHHVAESTTMLACVAKYFATNEEYRVPYLYRYFLDDSTEEQAARIFAWESELCRSEAITPVGIRLAGKRLPAGKAATS